MSAEVRQDWGGYWPAWGVKELAGRIGVTPSGVRSMLKRGEIPLACMVRIGRRRIRFVPGEVAKWLKLR